MSILTHILVATDFGPCSELAVDHAFALAARLGAKVHLLHVFSIPGLPDGAAYAASALDDAEQAAGKRLAEFVRARTDAGLLGEQSVRMGDPAKVILQVAAQLDADLIVLGTHGRRGLSRLLLGSVAESVVHNAECPVTVVRAKHYAANQQERRHAGG